MVSLRFSFSQFGFPAGELWILHHLFNFIDLRVTVHIASNIGSPNRLHSSEVQENQYMLRINFLKNITGVRLDFAVSSIKNSYADSAGCNCLVEGNPYGILDFSLIISPSTANLPNP
jgi:hypothetical protein